MIVTAAVPESLIDDANHLAMVLAEGPPDQGTYRINRQKDGTQYAVSSFSATTEWLQLAQGTLERPGWDNPEEGPYIVNMAGAERAQDALFVWTMPTDPENTETPPQAEPGRITVIIGPSALEAVVMMGLEPLEVTI